MKTTRNRKPRAKKPVDPWLFANKLESTERALEAVRQEIAEFAELVAKHGERAHPDLPAMLEEAKCIVKYSIEYVHELQAREAEAVMKGEKSTVSSHELMGYLGLHWAMNSALKKANSLVP
jgi:hypothetical protein